MNRKQLADLIERFPGIAKAGVRVFNSLPLNNRRVVRGRGNHFEVNGLLRNCTVSVLGDNNRMIISPLCRLYSTKITIRGSGNTIVLGQGCFMKNGDIHIEDDDNTVSIGERVGFAGSVHLASIEGSSITVGQGCLFSSGVELRTGDSHSLLSMSGQRINPSRDIVIEDRVWVGHRATILKGVTIQHDSVIATGAIVSASPSRAHVVVGGVPARVLKENVRWDIDRMSPN